MPVRRWTQEDLKFKVNLSCIERVSAHADQLGSLEALCQPALRSLEGVVDSGWHWFQQSPGLRVLLIFLETLLPLGAYLSAPLSRDHCPPGIYPSVRRQGPSEAEMARLVRLASQRPCLPCRHAVAQK